MSRTRKEQRLPFERVHTPAERKATGRRGAWWGGIQSTGDYLADEQAGCRAALAYLEAEAADQGNGGMLQLIVSDMPSKLGPIEIGFLSIVSYAAGAGVARGRRVVEYWERSAPQRAAAEAGGEAR